jgi:LSM domain
MQRRKFLLFSPSILLFAFWVGWLVDSNVYLLRRCVFDFFDGVFFSGIRTHVMVVCAGVLACLDGYMNIAMEQTEEYLDGQLKAKYGDCFIRGNNGVCVFVCSPCFCA